MQIIKCCTDLGQKNAQHAVLSFLCLALEKSGSGVFFSSLYLMLHGLHHVTYLMNALCEKGLCIYLRTMQTQWRIYCPLLLCHWLILQLFHRKLYITVQNWFSSVVLAFMFRGQTFLFKLGMFGVSLLSTFVLSQTTFTLYSPFSLRWTKFHCQPLFFHINYFWTCHFNSYFSSGAPPSDLATVLFNYGHCDCL